MKYLKHLLCMVLMLFLLVPGAAASESKGGGVDLQGILWGHIKDSYEWHVTNIGDKPVIINLPVIVKTSDGWYTGWAEDFAEEPIEKGPHAGYRPCKNNPNLFIATKGNYERRIVELQPDGTEVRPLDLSITKSVCVLFIDAILLVLCILIPASWCRKHKVTDKAPKGFTGLMHMFVMYVYDEVIKPTLGKESDKYAPYLLTCFFFIFVANIMGIVPFPPGGGNLTGNITITFFLAICTFLVTNFSGTKHYWKDIFWPDVPAWLKVPVPLMPVIEIFGIFTKPFALMVRLFANMMAGHAIALALTCIIFIMATMGVILSSSMTVVSVGMSIFMMLLEILVSFIQALVFTMLSAVFISLARVHETEAE